MQHESMICHASLSGIVGAQAFLYYRIYPKDSFKLKFMVRHQSHWVDSRCMIVSLTNVAGHIGLVRYVCSVPFTFVSCLSTI